MKIETLKQSHLKRNVIIGVGVVLIISAVVLNFTKAKYRVTESIPLVNGTINYTMPDFNSVAVYINSDSGYTKSDTIPASGYVLNETESYCTVNGERNDTISLSYNSDTKSLSVTPMTTKGTKCYLYFDEKGITNAQELIASKTIATRVDFSTTLTTDTTGTIYSAQDDDGTTYYFAGAPTDNWVRWAKDSSGNDLYWRIIRINGDGTLRVIYAGTDPTVTTGTGTQITVDDSNEFAFNSSYNNNAYVGYMYTSGSVHGTGTDSAIKTKLDVWYQNNLTNYAGYIDTNAGFCGDRTSTTTDGGVPDNTGGTGLTTTYYGARYRLSTNKTPTFKCSDKANDLYTTSSSNKGNKALTYPIGLITADEVAYAGGLYYQRDGSANNTSYYLYTGQEYWTMSPFNFNASGSGANVFFVTSTGGFYWAYVTRAYGVRPVINLKAETQFSSGNGTSENPFVVS